MSQKLTVETMFLGQYKNKKKLGKGAFGDVYLVEDKQNKEYALKLISRAKMNEDSQDNNLYQYLEDEIKCMESMDCRHIVKMKTFKQDQQFYYIILEYCDGGDLMNMQAMQPNKVYSLELATSLLSQVILGLEELHKKGYLHRDIKLQNVLIKSEGNARILKIADFGFSKRINNVSGTVLGTEQYMSPQIYKCGVQELGQQQQEIYGCEVDMWAFGVLFYYMLNLTFPFDLNPYWSIDTKYKELMKKAEKFSFKKHVQMTRKRVVQNCTPELQDLFSKIFQVDSNKRINFSEIRQHPVFAKHFPKPSKESEILYKTKFRSKIIKKGSLYQSTNLLEKAKKLKEGNLDRLTRPSIIAEIELENDHPLQKKILSLQLQEINFLMHIVQDVEIVEKEIGPYQTLMFAYNMMKYHIVLYRNFLKNLTDSKYVKRYKSENYNWVGYFHTQQFKTTKKKYAYYLGQTQMKFQNLHKKCELQLEQICKLNNSFQESFEAQFSQIALEGNFFRSYRKSTDNLYVTLQTILKSKKQLRFYYYLCATCICHVFNDFYENNQLKESIFSAFMKQQGAKIVDFSYEKFKFYLQNCGKQQLLVLTKRLIEECMVRK